MARSRFQAPRRTLSSAAVAQAHHVERIRAADRVRAAFGDDLRDPGGGVRAHVGDLGAPIGPEQVEEPAQGGGVAAGRSPHQRTGIVIHHDREVLVPLLVRDLVDPETAQPGEPVRRLVRVGPHPGDDRPHRAPGDAHQLTHRGLRRPDGQPGDRVVEPVGVARTMASPGHRRDHHPVVRAPHPRRVGLDEHRHQPDVQRPPPAPARSAVVARTPTPTHPAPRPRPRRRPHRHDHRTGHAVEIDTLDDRLLDTEHPPPYPVRAHAVSRLHAI